MSYDFATEPLSASCHEVRFLIFKQANMFARRHYFRFSLFLSLSLYKRIFSPREETRMCHVNVKWQFENFSAHFVFVVYFELPIRLSVVHRRYRYRAGDLTRYQKSAARTGDKVRAESPSRAGLDGIFFLSRLRCYVAMRVPFVSTTISVLHFSRFESFKFHLWHYVESTIVCFPTLCLLL